MNGRPSFHCEHIGLPMEESKCFSGKSSGPTKTHTELQELGLCAIEGNGPDFSLENFQCEYKYLTI